MAEQQRVLIVEDEELMRGMIGDVVSSQGLISRSASCVTEAEALARGEHFDLLITDLSLPGENGFELAKRLRKKQPNIQIIIVTAYPRDDMMGLKEEIEVSDFLVKPFSARQLNFSVLGALEKIKRTRTHEEMRGSCDGNLGLVGGSSYVNEVRKQVRLVAAGDFPVLIGGESGTGKELVARAIHESSARKDRKMITVNCAAIPTHLEESEFFGHVKGAFTGAHAEKKGLMESADQSTLFLDEIGELSAAVQAKLLRVLDTGEFTRVGEVHPRTTNIRIVSATNRDLGHMVEKGNFRKDLYFRLRGAMVSTQPLRLHLQDLPELVKHFLAGMESRKEITREALDLLSRHAWPGNVRELRHTVQLLVAATHGRRRINSTAVSATLGIDEIDVEHESRVPYNQAKSSFEKDYFAGALRRHRGNISRTAREVGMHRPSLLRKLRDLGISPERFRRNPA
jgi:DNA-binding NtrC family response regulator